MLFLRLRKAVNFTALTAVLLFLYRPCSAQEDTLTAKKKSGPTIAIAATGAAYAVTTVFLYSAWFSDYPQSSFHFFNDSGEWQYMDKIGHLSSTYYLSRWNTTILRGAGVANRKAAIIGTATAYGFMLGVEIMDGFSEGWGFSYPDIIANTLGASVFLLQDRFWHEQRATFKFSVHATSYAHYRPDLLGSTSAEHILKDYNGQTYWLSVNPSSFLRNDTWLPRWLNVALGYGAEGMLGASSNPTELNGVPLPVYDRYSQYYLSLDVDLTRIRTKSVFVKTLTEVFGFLKIPAPTLEVNGNGKVKLYPLYF